MPHNSVISSSNMVVMETYQLENFYHLLMYGLKTV